MGVHENTRCSEIVWPLVVMPKHEPFTYDVYVSGLCVRTAGTGNRGCKGHPGACVTLNLLLEGYSGKEIEEVGGGRR